jgi:hypothetical protein
MLDGRIDTQGTIKDLRDRGILADIEQEAAIEVKHEGSVLESEVIADAEDAKVVVNIVEEAKKPRKFIKDEHRESGGVKWSIYNTYLKAS